MEPTFIRIALTLIPGLEGITAINVWDFASKAMHELPSPVKFSISREVSPNDVWCVNVQQLVMTKLIT